MEFVASTPQQARLLLDLANGPLLALLMSGESSASRLATELGQDVRRVHYKLVRLCEADLVRVTREEKRAGRAVKLYRAAAREYRVPFSLTDAATLRELLSSLYTPFLDGLIDGLASQLTRRDARAITLTLNEQDNFQVGFDASPASTSFGALSAYQLTPARAAELRARLIALHDEFRALPEEEGARIHLVGLMLTPGGLPS